MARPQHAAVQTEPPPEPTDAAGWQAAVKDGSYERCRLEKVVIAIQDLRADLDKPTLHALSQHLSQCIFRILRSKVSRSYPNSGQDIIDDVHDVIWIAILDPQSKDGAALRKAFTPRLLHRLRDALRRQKSEVQNQAAFQSMARASSDGTASHRQEVALTINEALDQIPDDRKRLAFPPDDGTLRTMLEAIDAEAELGGPEQAAVLDALLASAPGQFYSRVWLPC